MRVVAWAAFLVFASVAQGGTASDEPTCRAYRNGESLITRVVFADGYTVEAPWLVVSQSRVSGKTAVTAVLHAIIEIEATGRRQSTALPDAVEMTFRGQNQAELLDAAATIWCATVTKARTHVPALSAPEVLPLTRT